jgi:hypothetical protein
VFYGTLQGEGVTNTNAEGIWLSTAEEIRPIARTGTPGDLGAYFPGGVNSVFLRYNLYGFRLSNNGEVAISAATSNSGAYAGVWVNSGATNQPIALVNTSGSLGPGFGPGVEFIGVLGAGTFTDEGSMVFGASVNQSDPVEGGQKGIWRTSDDGPIPIARTNTHGPLGPGLGGDTVMTFTGASIHHTGSIIIKADFNYTTEGISGVGYLALSESGNHLLALSGTEGALGPQMGEGRVFSGFNTTHRLGADEILTYAVMSGNGLDSTNDEGLWRISEQSISPVAVMGSDGELGPGLGEGIVFAYGPKYLGIGGYQVRRPFESLAGQGQTSAFVGRLSGGGFDPSESLGIFLNTASGISPIVLTQVADGYGPGLGEHIVFTGFDDVYINDDQSLVFQADVKNELNGEVVSGLWYYQAGVLSNVFVEGQTIVPNFNAPSNTHTVTSFTWHSIDTRHKTSALQVLFDDGSYSIMTLSLNIPGDLDGDGFVGITDLNSILPNWNQNVAPGDLLAGDVTGDGFVGIEDLNAVLGNWNAGTPPPTEVLALVPEPAAVCWLGVGLLGVMRRKLES